jgi:hypothetical protein
MSAYERASSVRRRWHRAGGPSAIFAVRGAPQRKESPQDFAETGTIFLGAVPFVHPPARRRGLVSQLNPLKLLAIGGGPSSHPPGGFRAGGPRAVHSIPQPDRPQPRRRKPSIGFGAAGAASRLTGAEPPGGNLASGFRAMRKPRPRPAGAEPAAPITVHGLRPSAAATPALGSPAARRNRPDWVSVGEPRPRTPGEAPHEPHASDSGAVNPARVLPVLSQLLNHPYGFGGNHGPRNAGAEPRPQPFDWLGRTAASAPTPQQALRPLRESRSEIAARNRCGIESTAQLTAGSAGRGRRDARTGRAYPRSKVRSLRRGTVRRGAAGPGRNTAARPTGLRDCNRGQPSSGGRGATRPRPGKGDRAEVPREPRQPQGGRTTEPEQASGPSHSAGVQRSPARARGGLAVNNNVKHVARPKRKRRRYGDDAGKRARVVDSGGREERHGP